jgi:hypothetical protein
VRREGSIRILKVSIRRAGIVSDKYQNAKKYPELPQDIF